MPLIGKGRNKIGRKSSGYKAFSKPLGGPMRKSGTRLAFKNYLELGQTSILSHRSVFGSEIS